MPFRPALGEPARNHPVLSDLVVSYPDSRRPDRIRHSNPQARSIHLTCRM
jgi:hypothetical protein